MMVSICWMSLVTWAAILPPPDPAIPPILGPGVFAVARVDLDRVAGEATHLPLAALLGDESSQAAIRSLIGRLDSLKRAGAREVYLVADVGDPPGMPVVVVPLSDRKGEQEIQAALGQPGPDDSGGVPVRGQLIAGPPAAVARIREGRPVERPDLRAALEAAGDAPIRLAISPGASYRRAIEESMTSLPAEVGGQPIEALTRGVAWASISLTTVGQPEIHLIVQADSGPRAEVIRDVGKRALAPIAAMLRTDPTATELADAVARIEPEVKADRVSVVLSPQIMASLVAIPLRRAGEAAKRSQSFDNIKTLGLALHNYHAAHGTFPPAFKAGTDGTPLLSWRVLILPDLDERKLYEEFHLDEPWDSPHNKPLVARMPAVFDSPAAARALTVEGKTTYLTPRGPDTIFPGAGGIKIQEITDGTSNTIAVAEVADEAAVTWTRPDDWVVGPKETEIRSPFGHYSAGSCFGYADGSARFIRKVIPGRVMRSLTTRAGGEVISQDDF